MTPEQEAKCREAFEAWLLNGNRFFCEQKDIFTAGYQAAWSAAEPQWLPIESAPLEVVGHLWCADLDCSTTNGNAESGSVALSCIMAAVEAANG